MMSLSDLVIAVCKDAIKTFDVEAQKDVCIEECSELINAIEKNRRGRNTTADVVTEIADVFIVCVQMALVFGWNAVLGEVKRKITRLAERIKQHKGQYEVVPKEK